MPNGLWGGLGQAEFGEQPGSGLTGGSKAQGARSSKRQKKKSKDHRLPSETEDDVIARLAGSRKPKLEDFNKIHIHTRYGLDDDGS